ncbi:MAG: non-hydrolyzing UDP-N-acetylglucosamine 2-epimerase [Terriglobales bacterium]
MLVLSVVGARPNFMKIAPLARELRLQPDMQHLLVHSGQHYDDALSGSFFRDLGLPQPDINLGVGSGSHAYQVAETLKRLEPVLLEQRPDVVMVVGDVNATAAGALAAAKLGVPVAHVEAGLRSFDDSMPEEINRKVTDVLSRFLFASEESGVENLRREGVAEGRIHLVGNVMIDTLLRHREAAAQSKILAALELERRGGGSLPYAVLTLHRPANVDDPASLARLLGAVASIDAGLPVLFPVHPRTRERLRHLPPGSAPAPNLRLMEPLGYLDFLRLMDQAQLVLTDSGGIQEETTVLGVPCLTLRENTERPATLRYGTNQLVGLDPERVITAGRQALAAGRGCGRRPPLWDGMAAERIVRVLREQLPVPAVGRGACS